MTPPPPVASRNLLAYGPASGSGLTATVNEDGSLHLAVDADIMPVLTAISDGTSETDG